MKKSQSDLKATDRQMQKWIVQMATGDTEALKLLYEALYQPMLLFAVSFLHDVEAAKDIVQEAFISAYHNAGQFQAKSSAKTWIFSITKHLSQDALKKAQLEEYRTEPEGYPEDFSRLESLEALALLDDEQQQIMILSVYGGFRIYEAAKLMAITENQAYYYKKTAVKKLKSYYSQSH